MTTALFTHNACLTHDTGPGHPERIERLLAIVEALADPRFDALDRREAPRASRADLLRVHPAAYVDHVFASMPTEGYGALDADTVLSPGSGEAALRAAGAVVAAVDAVMTNEVANAFCAVRPPGHHAEADRAMGFCLFNNVAVGAHYARAKHSIARVAVVDFDVHHGNGTQHIFERDAGLFYASTHQMPLYPGTGAEEEQGVGNICNAPLPPMAGSDLFRKAMERRILPALDDFAPELLIISAGFDAHADDPLAELMLKESDYAWATDALIAVAKKHCAGRVVSALEGGYNLDALARSTATHVDRLTAA
ncbi:MAG: histone deacetylase family protein [Rhodospirillaceae bacterium]|nr:histone deacetylase family protein [Rhodospirillaceae bacterium]